ncbi:MAG TPA: DUF6325 family protein [Thermomicrobiales bacterium]|jgi:hypothetical protein
MDEDLAPIDYIAIEFPDGTVSGEGFKRLLELVDGGVIRLLDLEFLAKSPDGSLAPIEPREISVPSGVDLSVWTGASSRLLDQSDLEEIGSAIGSGAVAAVVVYENRWVMSLVDAWRRAGARLIADGGIQIEEFVRALDATESTWAERSA